GLPRRAACRGDRVSPNLWKLHWSLMQDPRRRETVVGIFEDQATTFDPSGASRPICASTNRPS
ncbi:MAG: hypothetical protein ACRDSN_24805, partial [Pseudonocardiaceae bacterium]